LEFHWGTGPSADDVPLSIGRGIGYAEEFPFSPLCGYPDYFQPYGVLSGNQENRQRAAQDRPQKTPHASQDSPSQAIAAARYSPPYVFLSALNLRQAVAACAVVCPGDEASTRFHAINGETRVRGSARLEGRLFGATSHPRPSSRFAERQASARREIRSALAIGHLDSVLSKRQIRQPSQVEV